MQLRPLSFIRNNANEPVYNGGGCYFTHGQYFVVRRYAAGWMVHADPELLPQDYPAVDAAFAAAGFSQATFPTMGASLTALESLYESAEQ